MKRNFVIAAATAVVLAGAGTATALAGPSDNATAADSAAGGSAVHKAGDGPAGAEKPAATKADVTKAIDTAASAVPGTVTGVDLENDGHEWDVDVFGKDGKWYDVTLDPAGSKVLTKHLDADNDDREQRAPQGAPVTVQKAVEAALKATPGNVTEADLENGHWEIEVHDKNGKGHDVDVDAKSGKATVVKAQSDDGDDHDDDRGSDDAQGSDDARGADDAGAGAPNPSGSDD